MIVNRYKDAGVDVNAGYELGSGAIQETPK